MKKVKCKNCGEEFKVETIEEYISNNFMCIVCYETFIEEGGETHVL